jgi:hypothetical protein
MLLSGTIFNPSNASSADGTTNAVNQGRANEMLVAELHGKYFTQCYRGNVFYSSTASGGVIIPISTTLTPTYSVWNPSGSGKLLVPITLYVGWTATTAALGNIVWTSTTAASSGLSTSSGFSAFGSSTTVNGNLGAGNASVVRVASGGTTTLVAASTVYRATGFSITATTAATSVAPGWTWRDDYDGSMIIPPGNAVHIMATTAIAITAEITLVWAEVPL